MDLWGHVDFTPDPTPVCELEGVAVAILVDDDKRTAKKKCKHVYKELDKGIVHKGRYGVSYQWFGCALCKKKQRRNIT